MPRTFTGEAVGHPARLESRGGAFLMGPSWIDTACPNDMMDYDFTMQISEAREIHERLRLDHLASQTIPF